jgi:hypothetical protein
LVSPPSKEVVRLQRVLLTMSWSGLGSILLDTVSVVWKQHGAFLWGSQLCCTCSLLHDLAGSSADSDVPTCSTPLQAAAAVGAADVDFVPALVESGCSIRVPSQSPRNQLRHLPRSFVDPSSPCNLWVAARYQAGLCRAVNCNVSTDSANPAGTRATC